MCPRTARAQLLLMITVVGLALLSIACERGSKDEPAPPSDATQDVAMEESSLPARDVSMPVDQLTVELAEAPIRSFEVIGEDGMPPVVIEVHREGDGDACPDDATARIAFVARLADGTVWDSTEKRRFTLAVPLGEYGTIPGLRAAITGMQVGEVRRAYVPWQLGYGERGRAPIPPSTDLVFDIRLVAFEPSASGAESTE